MGNMKYSLLDFKENKTPNDNNKAYACINLIWNNATPKSKTQINEHAYRNKLYLKWFLMRERKKYNKMINDKKSTIEFPLK